jgi:7,8-dihydropterin-6-yl-methyl-4-(beta-D-ribofuranosyl)aminobenzene 5'-phosphate synthase
MNKSTVKITTLTENLVYASGLKAEHGLSIFIETPTANILFDTGQSDVFIHNATKLGVDIASVDTLILSHGHYDHTGGLYAFLELNSKAIVYAKYSLFKSKMHTDGRNIGTPYFQEKIEKRIHYVDSVLEVAPNISIFPTITIYNTIDTHFKGLQIQHESLLQEDTFEDELF